MRKLALTIFFASAAILALVFIWEINLPDILVGAAALIFVGGLIIGASNISRLSRSSHGGRRSSYTDELDENGNPQKGNVDDQRRVSPGYD